MLSINLVLKYFCYYSVVNELTLILSNIQHNSIKWKNSKNEFFEVIIDFI